MVKATAFILCALSVVFGAVACGSGGSSSDSQGIAIIIAGTPRPALPNAGLPPAGAPTASAPQTNAPASSGTEILDIAFSGAMQGAWRTGDRSAGLTCTVFGNNQLNIAMFGMLNNANYALAVHQDSFSPNA